MKRPYNFAAGPSTLAIDVLQEIEHELYDYQGTGMSIMEMTHRSKAFMQLCDDTKALFRKLYSIPENYEILFLQGGATMQFSCIPLNLANKKKCDYIITGNFSKKAAQEANKFAEVHIAYDAKENNYSSIPTQDELDLSSDAEYVHICSNNTIYGTQWKSYPNTNSIPLIADMSSDILSRKIDVSKFGLIYAGAQKNLGIAGLTIVIIRKDLLQDTENDVPVLLQYKTYADNDSMYNTPPCFSIYVFFKVLSWIEKQGGLDVIEKRNEEKAKLLYDVLDSSDFYIPHAQKEARSLMNVTFNCPSVELNEKFVEEAKNEGLLNIKGHRAVGGLRASIYNAMEVEGVEKLANFMKNFAERNRK
ncbi:MAG: 3-phosphoserine/phosphohydroxythreonine transaminase [Solobacterium sp.]|nr:3-phosphoserine/phosphohydroxythreonine transaminase [Solobacterium sp.]